MRESERELKGTPVWWINQAVVNEKFWRDRRPTRRKVFTSCRNDGKPSEEIVIDEEEEEWYYGETIIARARKVVIENGGMVFQIIIEPGIDRQALEKYFSENGGVKVC